MRILPTIISVFVLLTVLSGCQSAAADDAPLESIKAQNYPGTERAIKVIQRSKGVYLYEYRLESDPFKNIDPYKEYFKHKRITNAGLIGEIKALLEENKDFNPEYKKRCLPRWEYGLEFRESPEKQRMILFSFQCSTMMIFEEKVYRDFGPQNARLYALLKYQINNRTSETLK